MNLDIGLGQTQAVESEITYIDEDSRVWHRGYNLDEIILSDLSYEDVAYLMFSGSVPNIDDKIHEKFIISNPEIIHVLDTYKNILATNNEHPINSSVLLLSLVGRFFPKEKINFDDASQIITIYFYIVSLLESGKSNYPYGGQSSIVKNFCGSSKKSNILEKCLILIADHEINASTFTARVCASTRAHPVNCIMAALCTWSGALHGAANRYFFEMLSTFEYLEETEIRTAIKTLLFNKEKIMGFGHRVHKRDPRVRHYRYLSNLSKEFRERWVHEKALMVEQIMFDEKGIYPNCDLYASTTFYNLGISEKIHPSIFSLGRIIGWLSHINEQYSNNRLIRPRALIVDKKKYSLTGKKHE